MLAKEVPGYAIEPALPADQELVVPLIPTPPGACGGDVLVYRDSAGAGNPYREPPPRRVVARLDPRLAPSACRRAASLSPAAATLCASLVVFFLWPHRPTEPAERLPGRRVSIHWLHEPDELPDGPTCVPPRGLLVRKRLAPTLWKLESELKGCVIIEPHVKRGAPVTKDWGFGRFKALVALLPDLPWVQLGPTDTERLRGVRHVITPDIRRASAYMSQARAFVSPEGGMHHCAAAFNVPGVVIFGGYIAPRVTGYDMHVNLYTGGEEYPKGCGSRASCKHCERAMAMITPGQVAGALWDILRARAVA